MTARAERLRGWAAKRETSAAAYEENRNLAHNGPSGYVGSTSRSMRSRRSRVAIARAKSGRFLVDRETGEVFTILSYGKRGHRVGTLERLTTKYLEGTATFWPAGRADGETRSHGGPRESPPRHLPGQRRIHHHWPPAWQRLAYLRLH